MPNTWSKHHSEQFWAKRQWKQVGQDNQTQCRKAEYVSNTQNRISKIERDKRTFRELNSSKQQSANSERFIPQNDISNLSFWIEHASYTYCDKCKTILPLRLLPKFAKRPPIKEGSKSCKCNAQRYKQPQLTDIPDVLRDLSHAEICALRPLEVHTGDYFRAENGYRKKGGIFEVSWSTKAVFQKIEEIHDVQSRNKCLNAYNYLMNEPRSSYRNFVNKRDNVLCPKEKFNIYDSAQNRYIECCLWPNLYPTREFCETAIQGETSRRSRKISFINKVQSTILDYGTNYELLHFQYDMWLFKTVSGALTSGRFRMCSPARSLETKPFSVQYWKWQHRFLLDAITQFGPPSIFLTISPYEWSFPVPGWLSSLRDLTGKGPTELAAFETSHITHILDQIIRGYLCGSNDKKWSNHVFNHNNISTFDNIQTYFYRFEFQGRGTVHVHLLVWLKDIKRIRLNLLRADIPWSDPDFAFEVSNLQKSDKDALPLNDCSTQVVSTNGTTLLRLHHPADAFALNVRAYISSLVPSLKCRMDVQTSDGNGMLLRYVTSYVSKWQDSYDNESLYSIHVGPYQAAYKHVISMKPLEPEMWLSLYSTKTSWTPSRRKKLSFYTIENLANNATYMKYLRRSSTYSELSFLEWLRRFDEKKGVEHKSGSTLVGVKLVSMFKDFFFFQHMALNYPHSATEQLFHSDHQRLPDSLKFFAAAYTLMNDFWSDSTNIRSYLQNQGHKWWFIDTVISHVGSLGDYFKLWQRQVVETPRISAPNLTILLPINDPLQSRFIAIFKACLRKRDQYYEDTLAQNEEDDEENADDPDEYDIDGNDDIMPTRPADQLTLPDEDLDWKKVLLLTGKPGTGKTHCVKVAITEAIKQERDVLVATPTGFLASTYSAAFPEEIQTETVHAAFKYPVSPAHPCQTNWELMRYDVIVLDEVSMVSKVIMQHVISTINQISLRPLLVMCGDKCQQQPIETIDNQTTQVTSILQERDFYRIAHHINLTQQYRCEDEELQQILNHLRYYKPSRSLLEKIHGDRIMCATQTPSEYDVRRVLKERPLATFVTVSRKATNFINEIAINFLFADCIPLMHAQFDCDLPPLPLYQNLPVVITQNRDKKNGIMNGQRGIVKLVQNKTVFLTLPNGSLVTTHLVTCQKADGSIQTSYPFVPAYSLTICKSQGQTLDEVVIWMDAKMVPAGAAYVALSRVRRLKNLYFLTETQTNQYRPVREDQLLKDNNA